MRHLLYIIILLEAFVGSSWQETGGLADKKHGLPKCVQAETQYKNYSSILYREGVLSSSVSLPRTIFHSEERTETRTEKRSEPTSRGGGKAFKACHTPRSTIIFCFKEFVSCSSVTTRPHASHISLIYVLRHIIR